MRSTFFGLEIGKTGLTLGQLGLDLTGHNIANVDTAGYTRQRIVQTAYDPFSSIGRALPMEQARIGGGTRVKILDQIRSAYLDRRYRNENTTNSYWEKRSEGLSYLESFFDNVVEETSINSGIASLFGAVKTLADDAVEGAPRKLLQTAGHDLAQLFNTTYAGLIELQESQNLAVGTTVEEINSIATEIVELNKAVYSFEVTGHVANDLRDKRNLLLDELSTIVNIDYEEYSDGDENTFLKVSIGGKTLVDHDESWKLGTRKGENTIKGDPDIDKVDVPIWLDDNTDLTLKSGELKAYIDLRDNATVDMPGIPRTVEMLNNLAKALVQEVNKVHREGWTDPPVGDSVKGVNFFYQSNNANVDDITAENIKLSGEVTKSEYNIACSSEEIVKQGESTELVRGNNENMNALYKVFSEKKDIVLGAGATAVTIGSFDSYATSIREAVGITKNSSDSQLQNSNILTLAAENQRLSISGVSLDEEMTGLVKYNHAYTGAARVITAMDEVLDKLINGTGRVGL